MALSLNLKNKYNLDYCFAQIKKLSIAHAGHNMERYKKIDEGKTFIYYACTDGFVLRVAKKSYKEIRVKTYKRRGKAYIKFNRRDEPLKNVIASAFLKEHKPGAIVECIDGNIFNCSVSNLRIITKQEHGARTGGKTRKAQPVLVTFPDGTRREYPSVRAAARALYVSYQTIFDYLNRKYKKTVLADGWDIEKIERN